MNTILVDTSVWSAALRRRGGDPTVREELGRRVLAGETRLHPAVLGELILGGLGADARARLEAQRRVPSLDDTTVLAFADRHALSGRRIGWVDAHLLAAAEQSGARLWTLDRALTELAATLGLSFDL